MQSICSTEEIQEIENLQIQGSDQVAMDLMETAGRKAAEAIIKWKEKVRIPSQNHYHVLCGPGNNGGDGFVIARTLVDMGEKISCWELIDSPNRSAPSTLMRSKWLQKGSISPLEDFQRATLSEGDIVVDALFGIGLTRPLDKKCSKIIEGIPSHITIIAIDILSGLDSSTGSLLSSSELSSYEATLTLTFQIPKWGHYLQEGAERSGTIEVISIGLDEGLKKFSTIHPPLVELVETQPPEFIGLLDKKGPYHKYDHGHSLILSGPPGKMGAAELAGISALRVGSGLVTMGLPKEAFFNHTFKVNALMATKINKPQDMLDCLSDKRINAICLGPGLGIGKQTREYAIVALKSGQKAVLDADALTSFQENPDVLYKNLHNRTVITPHFGEFARIFPDLATKIKGDKLSVIRAVQKASTISGAVVLLKGRQTVIASPDGHTYLVNGAKSKNSPWLATGGSGDVLAGMITGLMARNIPPLKCALLSVYIHLHAVSIFGPGLIADDLPKLIPKVLNKFLLN